MKVLAIDFDGVICDSLREVFATALTTYEVMERDSPLISRLRSRRGGGRWYGLELSDDPIQLSFEAMMPFGNRAEDFGVSLRAIESYLEFTDQRAYDTFHATIDPDWLRAFHLSFYDQRDAARAFDLHGWLDLHEPFHAFLELLRRRVGDAALAVATAKDRRSAELLLAHLGAGGLFAHDLILDKETGVSKTAHLTALRDLVDVAFEDITFIDDKVNHLESVAPLGVRPVLAAWGFNTEREHRRARECGFAVANVSNAERVLYGGGADD